MFSYDCLTRKQKKKKKNSVDAANLYQTMIGQCITNKQMTEPTENTLECDSVVWWVLSHESLIKSRHVEARQDLRLQCKLWPEPNAWLSCPGARWKRGLFAWGDQSGGGGGVSKLLES